MQRMLFAILSALLLLHGQVRAQAERPQAEQAFAANGVTVELYQNAVQQGHAGLMRVVSDGLVSADAEIFSETRQLFAVASDDALYGFIVPDLDQPIRTYDMTITVGLENGETRALLVPVDVRSGEFLQQEVTLRPDQLDLIDPSTERSELSLLSALADPITPARYWNADGFEMPFQGELTSPFGAVRLFNEDFETRHTGWDFQGDQGDIMRAMADGRVVYSGSLDIRGGYVMMDHGQSVYSGYAHLSVTHVEPGQFVRKGQVIGLAGSTGRSSAPHLHVEMRVHNRWVDPVDFVNMWLP